MKVCITGGTGTLGQALTRRLLKTDCERIVILSRDEAKQAMMALDIGLDPRLRFFLGDVRDCARLRDAFWGIDVVIHAAALKRVDAVAYNPSEVRKTNVEGSANVTAAALAAAVPKVLMVSSDKACHPTNMYGVTKAAMEHEAIASNAITYPRGTAVSCVRYGNVLGSRGSVVYAWRQAVAEGRPIPLTDPYMTRFWLTVDDAVGLILWAIEHMHGGEIFVPDMMSMRLAELAQALAPGHPTEVTGLRPGGEKLHETVLTDEESKRSIAEGGVCIINPELHPWSQPIWAGKALRPGEARSDLAPRLSVEEMRKMLADLS